MLARQLLISTTHPLRVATNPAQYAEGGAHHVCVQLVRLEQVVRIAAVGPLQQALVPRQEHAALQRQALRTDTQRRGSPRQQSNVERVDIKPPPQASLGAPRALTSLSRAPRASPLRSAAGRRGSAQFNDGGGCGARSSRAGSPPAGPDMARMRCDCAARGGRRRGPRAIILCGFHASESAWSTPAISPRCARLSRHAPPGTTRALLNAVWFPTLPNPTHPRLPPVCAFTHMHAPRSPLMQSCVRRARTLTQKQLRHARCRATLWLSCARAPAASGTWAHPRRRPHAATSGAACTPARRSAPPQHVGQAGASTCSLPLRRLTSATRMHTYTMESDVQEHHLYLRAAAQWCCTGTCLTQSMHCNS